MKKSTIFCDIDGTLFHYRQFSTYKISKPTIIVTNVTRNSDFTENQTNLFNSVAK